VPSTKVCGGCGGAPAINDDAAKTYYCSTVCQHLGWSEHRARCQLLQNRKKLYRAGAILQAMFYKYREQVFDKVIARVEEKNGQLFLYQGDPATVRRGPLVAFPNQLFANEKDKKAALVLFCCTDALAFMHDFAAYLLSGE
jgi:hypothetical protein